MRVYLTYSEVLGALGVGGVPVDWDGGGVLVGWIGEEEEKWGKERFSVKYRCCRATVTLPCRVTTNHAPLTPPTAHPDTIVHRHEPHHRIEAPAGSFCFRIVSFTESRQKQQTSC